MDVGSVAIGITAVGEHVIATQKKAENSQGHIVLENLDACDDTLD